MYIDDLFAAEKLVPSPIKDWEERWHGGYEGLQFREAETSEFQLTEKHLRMRRDETLQRFLALRARQLLSELEADIDSFGRAISGGNQKGEDYSRVGIMKYIDPITLAKTTLKAHPEQQRRLLQYIELRYKDGRISRELSEERQWLAEVQAELLKMANEASGIAKFRLEKFAEWYLARISHQK